MEIIPLETTYYYASNGITPLGTREYPLVHLSLSLISLFFNFLNLAFSLQILNMVFPGDPFRSSPSKSPT